LLHLPGSHINTSATKCIPSKNAYDERPLQEHSIAKFVDTKHFMYCLCRVSAVRNFISWNDIPILYSIACSNSFDFLPFPRAAYEPSTGDWQEMLEIPREGRISGCLVDLSFAETRGRHFGAAVDARSEDTNHVANLHTYVSM
jgi:hypothetical protein